MNNRFDECHLTMPQVDPIRRPPGRRGKRAVTGFFDPCVSKQLRQLALDRDTTVQDLLREALHDLFEKYQLRASPEDDHAA